MRRAVGKSAAPTTMTTPRAIFRGSKWKGVQNIQNLFILYAFLLPVTHPVDTNFKLCECMPLS